MYYLDETPINLSLLNPQSVTGGRKYSGQNTDGGEILAKIALKWADLHEKYKADEAITFIRPHMRGSGGDARGGSYMRQVVLRTTNGTKTLTWCDQAMKTAGGALNFIPRRFKHDPNDPQIGLTLQDDIEKILWFCLFDGLRERSFTYPQKDNTGKPHPKAGKTVPGIFILDKNDEAADFLKMGEKSVATWFYLTSQSSPIAGDREAVNFLSSVWGVTKPEAMSDLIARQTLIQAVESGEQKGDKQYGYVAFENAVKSYLSKDDTTNLEMLALINRAIDRGILKYMPSKLAWFLMTENGIEIKKMCQVNTTNANKEKDVMVQHLLSNDDDLTLIQGSVEAKPIIEKIGKKIYIPEPLTLEYLKKAEKDGGMRFPHLKSICTICGIDSFGKNKDTLADLVYDKLVVQKFPFPAENRLDKPDETGK